MFANPLTPGVRNRARTPPTLFGDFTANTSWPDPLPRLSTGEVSLRIVGFAHTTTGRNWLPYIDPSMDFPAHFNVRHPKVEEVVSGKGYPADVDPATGCMYARFLPHCPDQPVRGFLWGLRSMAGSVPPSLASSVYEKGRLPYFPSTARKSPRKLSEKTEVLGFISN